MTDGQIVDVTHLMSVQALRCLAHDLLVLANMKDYSNRLCNMMNRLVFYLAILHGVQPSPERFELKEAYEKVIGCFVDFQNQGANDHISYLVHASTRLSNGISITLEPNKEPVCAWTEGSPIECQTKVNSSGDDFRLLIRHVVISVTKSVVVRFPEASLVRASTCAICLDEIDTQTTRYRVFRCTHAMHTTCIVELLSNDMVSRDGFKPHGPVCPECRAPLF
jgi:hypothetical protein